MIETENDYTQWLFINNHTLIMIIKVSTLIIRIVSVD